MANRPTDVDVLLLRKVRDLFPLSHRGITGEQSQMTRHFSGWSGRLRSAQRYLLICCPLSKIIQTVHPVARETPIYPLPLRHLSATSP